MNCRAIGNPTPKIHWLKDMKRVDISSTSRYTLLDGKLFDVFNTLSSFIHLFNKIKQITRIISECIINFN